MCLPVYCDILHYVFVIYVEYYYYELIELGPEGPPEFWERRVPLRHIDRRVLFEYSHERLMRYVWYFGELTKLRAYCVMCYVFQVLLRITGRHRLDCTHMSWRYVLEDPGLCFKQLMNMCF